MGEDEEELEFDLTIPTVIALTLGLGAVALVLGHFIGPSPRLLIPRPEQWGRIAWGCGIGALAALPPAAVVWALQFVDIKPIREMQELSRSQLEPMLRELSWPEIGSLGLAAGVGEELLFRGWLMALIAGPVDEWTPARLVLAVSVSAFGFGLAHPISATYVVFAAAMGVYLGSLLAVTENLLVPIAAHALYDIIMIGYFARIDDDEEDDETEEPEDDDQGDQDAELPEDERLREDDR